MVLIPVIRPLHHRTRRSPCGRAPALGECNKTLPWTDHAPSLIMTRVPESSTSIPFVTPNGTRCTTYVKVIGDLGCGKPPVIAIHGGPGGGHEYLLPFAALWNRHGIPVIFYDQIGCGGSSRVSEYDGDKSFWTVELFMSELDNLIDHFKLQDGPGYDVLGQSWGAMMAAMLATKRPKGLRRVILASGVADMDLSVKGYNLCIKLLSTEHQKAIDEAVASGDYTAANYKAAMDAFHRAFLCRSEVFPPPELIPALQHLTETKVWSTMYVSSAPTKGLCLSD